MMFQRCQQSRKCPCPATPHGNTVAKHVPGDINVRYNYGGERGLCCAGWCAPPCDVCRTDTSPLSMGVTGAWFQQSPSQLTLAVGSEVLPLKSVSFPLGVCWPSGPFCQCGKGERVTEPGMASPTPPRREADTAHAACGHLSPQPPQHPQVEGSSALLGAKLRLHYCSHPARVSVGTHAQLW